MGNKEKERPREPEEVVEGPETPQAAQGPAEGVCGDELARVQKERDEYLDLARRARADYQNLQRRVEVQSAAVRKEAQQRFALDMIAVLDDLDRALDHIRQSQDVRAVVKGIELLRENFLAALAAYGIAPIDAMGAKFDHEFHHAIAEQPTDEAPAGTVVAVAQRGYLADGKLLRPAQVVVASAPPDAQEAPANDNGSPGD